MTQADLAIGIITRGRPHQLASLLRHLAYHEAVLLGNQVDRIIIVDNDSSGSSRGSVESASFRAVRVVYAVEPEVGFASARNRVIDLAQGCRYLAFIDDDDEPEASWLNALVATQIKTGAAIVGGPRFTTLPPDAPRWALGGALDSDRPVATGERVEVAATNNMLIDLHQVDELRPLFDRRFNHSGGEDAVFCLKVAAAGRLVVWCREAVVRSSPPASRLRLRYLLQRAFLFGMLYVRRELLLEDRRRARLRIRHRSLKRGWAGIRRSPQLTKRGLSPSNRAAIAWEVLIGVGRLTAAAVPTRLQPYLSVRKALSSMGSRGSGR